MWARNALPDIVALVCLFGITLLLGHEFLGLFSLPVGVVGYIIVVYFYTKVRK